MDEKLFFKIRLYFTAIVTIAMCIHLAWDHYHGGVPAHHILNNKDLPKISNWWGLLVVPFLTWLLLYRIQHRIFRSGNATAETSQYFKHTLYRFAGALLFGVLLSVFFSFGMEAIPGYMLLCLFPLALFFPLYRAECLLGFIIGMEFTFGGVLPTLIGSILLLLCAVIYLFIRRAILYVASKFRRT